eukprot:Hpha_TRINITY_DN14460_c0_g1::TRINITY_DN14460_c0_g1_i1::g.157997::m.157997
MTATPRHMSPQRSTRACDHCGKIGATKQCPCRMVCYCDETCQGVDWARHLHACSSVSPRWDRWRRSQSASAPRSESHPHIQGGSPQQQVPVPPQHLQFQHLYPGNFPDPHSGVEPVQPSMREAIRRAVLDLPPEVVATFIVDEAESGGRTYVEHVLQKLALIRRVAHPSAHNPRVGARCSVHGTVRNPADVVMDRALGGLRCRHRQPCVNAPLFAPFVQEP